MLKSHYEVASARVKVLNNLYAAPAVVFSFASDLETVESKIELAKERIYDHCFELASTEDHWTNAASGGAGGCGGYGGKAGGTGGSAIGLVLIPPSNINGYFDVSSTASAIVTAIGTAGGQGTPGQNGQVGGHGGKAFGWADENFAGTDRLLH